MAYGELAENFASTLIKGNRVIVSGELQQRTYEAQDGTQKSKVEIVANEIAPSLRWATAEITRTPPRDEGGNARPSTPRSAPSQEYGGARYEFDEEPF